MLLTQHSDEDSVLLEIRTDSNFRFYAASMYFDRLRNIEHDIKKLEKFLSIASNNPILVAVDSNARSSSWFDSVNNDRGRSMEECLFANSLFTLNTDNDEMKKTFETVRAGSNIDLTIVNYCMLRYTGNWMINDAESASDHKFISFEISLNKSNVKDSKSSYKYNTLKADWKMFRCCLIDMCRSYFGINCVCEQIDDEMTSLVGSADELDAFVVRFMEVVGKACDEHIPKIFPKKNGTQRRSVRWWSDELTKLRKLTNKSRRKFQRTKSDEVLREVRKAAYYDVKSKYKRLLNKSKLDSWREFCNATNKSQPWNYIYKAAAGKLKSDTVFTSLCKEDGSITNTLDETLNVLLDKFVPQDDPLTDNDYNKDIRHQSIQHAYECPTDIPFNRSEIETVIKSFDPKKTPGEDGFSSDIILQVFHQLPSYISAMYNECLRRGRFPDIWKKSCIIAIVKPGKENSNGADKYRPISLLSLWGKILEKLYMGRIMHHLYKNDSLSGRQYGFTPQKSTVDAIMEVGLFVEGALENREIVLLVSLDVKGAFDAAWWPSILSQLRKFKCPGNLYLLAADFFVNREAGISTNTLSLTRRVTRGCPQGSCSGPGMWNIQYDSLLKENFPLGVLVVAFADDLLIGIRGKMDLEVECLGNECMRTIEKWSSCNKVVFNSDKTKMLLVSRKLSHSVVSVFLNGKRLDQVEELKYLGVTFDSKWTWNNHISNICDKSLQLVNRLSKSAKVYWGISSEALRIIYDGALIPLLTYALPAWYKGITKLYNMNKLRRVQRLFLLRLIKGFRTISYEATNIIAEVLPIEIKIEEVYRKYQVMKGLDHEMNLELYLPTRPGHWMHPGLVPLISVREISDCQSSSLLVYTDGSKMESKVGCAFVVFRQEEVLIEKRYRLAECCSNNQAELLAIFRALSWFADGALNEVSCFITVVTDSQVALDSLLNRRNHFPLVEDIRKALAKLTRNGFTVEFCKVAAHTGEAGNETADMLAKQAAEDTGLIFSLQAAPVTYVMYKLHQLSLQKWEHSWSMAGKGALTKEFFPSVAARLKSPIKITYKATQFLSGHGRSKAYLHRFQILSDAVCSCDGSSWQTWDHILYHCCFLERERAVLMRQVVTKGYSWPVSRNVLVSEKECEHFQRFIESIDFEKLLM